MIELRSMQRVDDRARGGHTRRDDIYPCADRWARPAARVLGSVAGPSRRGGAARVFGLTVVSALAMCLAVCGDSDPVTADPAVAPFVGDWDATEFTVTNDADPEEVFHVTDGGAFTLNVQPSGHYTAILEIEGLAEPEVEQGRVDVSGTTIILDPNEGPSATATFTFEGENRVVLVGPTEFDFNFDGDAEPSEARIVLERR